MFIIAIFPNYKLFQQDIIMDTLNRFKNFLESIEHKNPSFVKNIIEAVDSLENVNVKPGANVNNIEPAIADTIPVVEKAFKAVVGDNYKPTITSGNDSDVHDPNSMHYKNMALDWRTNDINSLEAKLVTELIKKSLGDNYFVDFEDPGTDNQHIHIQVRKPGLPPHSEAYYRELEEEERMSLERKYNDYEKNERNVLSEVASRLQVDPSHLYRLINFESGWNPKAKNPYSSARGLIQFIDSTARELGYENSLDLVEKNPTVEEQLAGPVYQYLKKYAPFPNEQSLYMAVFYPVARRWSLGTEFPEHVKKVNPGIEVVGDYVEKVRNKSGAPVPVNYAYNNVKPSDKQSTSEQTEELKSADIDGFKKYAEQIVNIAKKEKQDPALMLALIHNLSGYDANKSKNGREGLLQIKEDLVNRFGIGSPEENLKIGTKLFKLYKNEFGSDEMAMAALKIDPAVVNDTLVSVDKAYSKKEFPYNKWDREGIYRGKRFKNLPPKTKSREKWEIVKNHLQRAGKGGQELLKFIDDVKTHRDLYESFASRLSTDDGELA